jgi:hypothetical protein
MKYLLPIALLFISFSAFAQDPKPQAAASGDRRSNSLECDRDHHDPQGRI